MREKTITLVAIGISMFCGVVITGYSLYKTVEASKAMAEDTAEQIWEINCTEGNVRYHRAERFSLEIEKGMCSVIDRK